MEEDEPTGERVAIINSGFYGQGQGEGSKTLRCRGLVNPKFRAYAGLPHAGRRLRERPGTRCH